MGTQQLNVIKGQLENASQKYPIKIENVDCDSRDIMCPLIKAYDATSGVHCKLSFNNKIYVEAGKRLKDYIEAMPLSKCHINHTLHSSQVY